MCQIRCFLTCEQLKYGKIRFGWRLAINTELFYFKLGSFQCTVVCDGKHIYAPPTFPAPADFLFSSAPREQVEEAYRQHDMKPEDQHHSRSRPHPRTNCREAEFKREKLLFISDIMYHPLQVAHPEWSGIADLDPQQAVKTRLRFLEMAASERALVLGFHFPFPGLGWVLRDGGRYRWQVPQINSHDTS